MIYHLFDYLSKSGVDFPGIGLMQYITFRALIALMTALLVALYAGPKIIKMLQKKQIGEDIRDLGLEGQMQKKGTPTMGGIIIILSLVIPALLFGNLTNIYVQLLIVTAIWLGLIGFLDDSIKVFKKNKDGLSGKYKIIGQVTLGLVVGLALCMSDQTGLQNTLTTIPFIKDNQFDYAWLSPFGGEFGEIFTRIIYVVVVIFVITAVSNGSNLTDGMDGLATGVSAFIGITIAILAYLSGNTIYASYLDIMYIPHSGEVVIFMSAFIGALVGFLWYNTYPAQVFMGDTGSLALGGIIAVSAILLRKELLIPVMCGIFLVESLSVIMQRYYFKYTKKKYGEGRRIFKMSPLHHHFQKEGIPAIIQTPQKALPEAKIVVRFWIITILLCAITIITLKIR
ncbi:MAG: phospho-N-acetylmuramoyl-pentapeptide-transferase [Bacteroidales bacterium]|nr:phospho-N-acetylmuramoyl-pentapeptide-transferase [Bacteroidales bacterium]MBQ8646493.1 phospho-N-acetylmuramoyl-pentapeptide-transferase [Bacteroidales bacterium]MBR1950231.1 phospho-N-acetylmuramoyl-pentapeptide-transferase [Bacteroidales bacterium]